MHWIQEPAGAGLPEVDCEYVRQISITVFSQERPFRDGLKAVVSSRLFPHSLLTLYPKSETLNNGSFHFLVHYPDIIPML